MAPSGADGDNTSVEYTFENGRVSAVTLNLGGGG
jgi:hypothetical protein